MRNIVVFKNPKNNFDYYYFHGFPQTKNELNLNDFISNLYNTKDIHNLTAVNSENFYKLTNFIKDYTVNLRGCIYCKRQFNNIKLLILHLVTSHLEYEISYGIHKISLEGVDIDELHIFSFSKMLQVEKDNRFKKERYMNFCLYNCKKNRESKAQKKINKYYISLSNSK